MCRVSKYLQAVAEDEWLWKGVVREILIPDDELMPMTPLPKASRSPSAVDVIGPRASYSLLGPFYHSNSLAPPQHHTRRFQYHQSRGPWWKSVFKRHKTFLRDSAIPVICYRTMSYPPVANCVRAVRGPLIAVGGWKDIRLVNFRSGSVTKMLRGHTGFVTCFSGGCGGNILVSGSEDGTVLVWDTGLSSSEAFVTARFDYHAAVRAVVYEPTNNLVIFGGDESEIHIHSTPHRCPMLDAKSDVI
jgi:WD40 repeat protein